MPVTPLRRIAIGAWAGLVALALVAGPALGAAPVDQPTSGDGSSATSPTPVSLAVLVPLTVRPSAPGLIDAATLAGYTAPLGVLTRQLDAVIGTPAVIGIDPMIIASIRVLGSSAPASATSWLERLRTSGNEVFSLAYADADLAALARANALQLRDPVGFNFALNPRNFGPALTATPTPSASASSTAQPAAGTGNPPLPTTTAEVLAWSYTLASIAWPADDTVVGGDLPVLAGAGYRSVVLSSSNVSATASGYVDLPGIHGIVADAGITSLVRAAVYSSDAAGPQEALDRVNSALRGMAAVSPGRTVVATLDRRWPLGALNLHALFDDLAGQSSVRPVGLTAVFAGSHPNATVVDEPGDASRASQISLAVQAIATEAAFSSVATDPTAITAPRRLALLALLAVSWLRGTDDWAGQLTTFLGDSQTLIDSVQIVAGSDLVVGSGSTNIPVTVSNALSVPVTVYVNVDSPSSVLQVRAENVPLTVEPGSSNKAAIPVAALTNGKVDTTITLTSATGVSIGVPDSVSVDLHPGWESVGTTIVITLLVLIFGGGLARNIVKRRAARRADPAEADGD
ncbi:MAG TPA: DUF6049 family protein [Pseudolysinimonas sp.]|nr:DUF6049 family protein [Pseudolysinimonas sp.]